MNVDEELGRGSTYERVKVLESYVKMLEDSIFKLADENHDMKRARIEDMIRMSALEVRVQRCEKDRYL